MMHPTSVSERIASLDVLRGFAVLGILVMNMQSYSMISAAYINPSAHGDLTGLNMWVWVLSHVFGDQKFMTIFSVMFGAGIVLMSARIGAAQQRPASTHYRRMLWLFVIGMLHAYLLWYGDILVAYALCGTAVFAARRLAPRRLLITGLILIAVPSIFQFLAGWSMRFWDATSIEGIKAAWTPGIELIEKEITAYRGVWSEQMVRRVPTAFWFQTFLFVTVMAWRAGGLMLVGMALLKWNVLTAERTYRFYRMMVAAGLVIGIPVIVAGINENFTAGWTVEYSMFLGSQYNYLGSLFLAAAYVGTVMLACKFNWLPGLRHRFAAVGRTALSNYLLQTLICTTLFYGHGFGLFGEVGRVGQIVIVVGIWVLQLIISPLWLRYFRFGPAEWLWRSLTYGQAQPIRAENITVVQT